MTHAHDTLQRGRLAIAALTLGALGALGIALHEAPAAEPALIAAPVNPEFEAQLSAATMQSAGQLESESGELPRGYIPSPVDRAHMTGLVPADAAPMAMMSGAATATYPASFDLRSSLDVTGVRNQGACGSCWAFSAIASLESNTLMGGGGTTDLSENHLNVRHGFDPAPCAGGNSDIAGAYMTRWGNPNALAAGPVYETDDPYTSTLASSVAGLAPRAHLQEFLVLPDRATKTDNDNYKYALQNYGAVDVSIYADGGMASSSPSAYWNQTTKSYYYTGTAYSNHAVTLVGWDDNYAASNFRTTPPGNGAFIVRNSWGTGWGAAGYFYISYYDARLGDAHVFRMAEGPANYSRAYLYDPFGNTSSIGYGSPTAYGANVFQAAAAERLTAVAFYTGAVGASYEISIYTGVSGAPSTGTLEGGAVNTTGSFPFAGYHTVTLSRPVSLSAGQKFAVVVKFTTPGYNYPIPMEFAISGYDSAATAGAGQSYLSGTGTSWADLTSYYATANINIRAFSNAAAPQAPTAVTAAASVITPDKAQINGTVNDNGATTTVSFDYGPTAGYGTTATATPGTISAGAGSKPVLVSLSGLSSNTTYHYRVKGVNSAGTGTGSDLTFTTAAGYAIVTTANPSTGGTLGCTPNPVGSGGTSTCTAAAAAGYFLASWAGDCAGQTGTTCTLGKVTSAKTVTANFSKKITPTVSAWPKASAISYGQTLASAGLSGGSASVPGTFAFVAPATAPGVGTAGQAVTFTPTAIANYNTVAGSVSVTVTKATPSVTAWPTAATIAYGQTLAAAPLSGGSATVPGTFAFTAPTTVPGVGTASQAVTFTPSTTANYNTVAGKVSVTVIKATPSVTTWPTATIIAYGQTLASAKLSGGSATVPGTFAFTTSTTAPGVGTASQAVTFTPTATANYNPVAGSVGVTVTKATPSVSAWPKAATIAYGQTLAAAPLSGGSASVPGTFAFTAPTTVPGVGTVSQAVTFTPSVTANYNTVAGKVSVTVTKATPSVTAWPTAATISYGRSLAAVPLSGGSASVPGTFAFTAPTTVPAVGTAAQAVTFTPSAAANYNKVAGSVSVTVIKATPSVTAWPTATTIAYGQTLASAKLSGGTASVSGSFAYTAPTTAPGVGTAAQALTFTPTATANYDTVAGSVSVTVTKATPSVTAWPKATAITYGQTLARAQLSGGAASVPGTFAFTAPTTVPAVGTTSQAVTFTPTTTANYNTVAGRVSVTVNR